MKVLLIYPRFWPYSSPPLGLAYIASYMRDKGIDVSIIDCTFNMNKKKLIEAAKEVNPDVIGVAVITGMVTDMESIISQLRSAIPKAVFVAGGTHASAFPEIVLRNYGFDIVARGECERIFVNLVNALKSGKALNKVKGISYIEGNKLKVTEPEPLIEDLSELPFPARDLLPMKDYLDYRIGRSSWTVPTPSTTTIGTRGCPYRCTFCATNANYGGKIRYRSAKNYADEIELLVNEYGVKGIWFNDDTFTMDRNWAIDIFDQLASRKIHIKWGCNTRVNVVNEELLRNMKS